MSVVNVDRLKQIAEVEFSGIVLLVDVEVNRMRIMLIDNSFIDIWYSLDIEGRYSYHWERKRTDGTIYRHDNVPHQHWMNISTFPKHFHYKSETNVMESYINDDPESALREFMNFAQKQLVSYPYTTRGQ